MTEKYESPSFPVNSQVIDQSAVSMQWTRTCMYATRKHRDQTRMHECRNDRARAIKPHTDREQRFGASNFEHCCSTPPQSGPNCYRESRRIARI